MGKLDTTHKVYEIANTRINATDTKLKMPPVSIDTRPTAAAITALTNWFTAGAMPAATGGCAITQGTIDMGGTMNADAGTMPPPGTHMGGASIDKIEYDDPEMKCYKFITHEAGDASTPYSVGTTPDMYTNFTFAAQWTGTQYARSFEIITGNSEVIHHWLFFRNTVAEPDLAVQPGSGTHPDGILLHGWAPGASPMYYDPDVGVEMPADTGYTLETHHNNTTGAPAPDSSGVEVCVTPKVPTHIATISWLGSDAIAGTSAMGTCDPSSNDDIHLIAAQPHMHLKGQHMKVVLNRAAGGTEIVHDADFSFDYQRYYVFDFVMQPGDTLDTTCTYSQPATFGQSTQNEMCYFFTVAWPPLALTSPNFASSAIHGQNTCM
jgi:copper type II ascorbate-dependent monooxygenase-like protein